MSILIKGMEMPPDGTAVAIVIHANGDVGFLHEDDYRQLKAVPVPPHGDLIDYEFCMKNYELLHDDDGNPVYAVRMRDINSAPTIIPAEEE